MAINPAAQVPTGNPGAGVQVVVNPTGALQGAVDTMRQVSESTSRARTEAARATAEGNAQMGQSIGQGLARARGRIHESMEAEKQRAWASDEARADRTQRDIENARQRDFLTAENDKQRTANAEEARKDREQRAAETALREKQDLINRRMMAAQTEAQGYLNNDPIRGTDKYREAMNIVQRRRAFEAAKNNLKLLRFSNGVREAQGRADAERARVALGAASMPMGPAAAGLSPPPASQPAVPQAPAASQPSAWNPGDGPPPASQPMPAPTPPPSSQPQYSDFLAGYTTTKPPIHPETRKAIRDYYETPTQSPLPDFAESLPPDQLLARTDFSQGVNGYVNAIASMNPAIGDMAYQYVENFSGAKPPASAAELKNALPPQVTSRLTELTADYLNQYEKAASTGALSNDATTYAAAEATMGRLRQLLVNVGESQGRPASEKALAQYYFGKLNLGTYLDAGDWDGAMAVIDAEDKRMTAEEDELLNFFRGRYDFDRQQADILSDIMRAEARGDFATADNLRVNLRAIRKQLTDRYNGLTGEAVDSALGGSRQDWGNNLEVGKPYEWTPLKNEGEGWGTMPTPGANDDLQWLE